MTEDFLRNLAFLARGQAHSEAAKTPCRDLLKCAEYLRAAHTFDREADLIRENNNAV